MSVSSYKITGGLFEKFRACNSTIASQLEELRNGKAVRIPRPLFEAVMDLQGSVQQIIDADKRRTGLQVIAGDLALDGRRLYVDALVEIRFPDGAWILCVLEGLNADRTFSVRFAFHATEVQHIVSLEDDEFAIRWPITVPQQMSFAFERR